MQLSISLFGQFQLTCDDQPITAFGSDKARALLAYLALEQSRAHSRNALATLLWPEYLEENARTNLRQTIHLLRATLGDKENATTTEEQNESQPFLLISRQTVQFNPAAPCTVDVVHFQQLLQRCAEHLHPPSPWPGAAYCPVCRPHLLQAVNLYRGEFLQDFPPVDSAPFEEWRRITQERLHLRMVELAGQLANAFEAAGDEEQCRFYAARQLALEPWHEEAHRQIMRSLARQGQRTAALAHYQSCRQLLLDELGIEPSAVTQSLYAQIAADVVALPNLAPPVTPVTQPAPSPTPALTVADASPPELPFSAHHDWGEMPAVETLVGRAAELAQLQGWLVPTDGLGARLISILGIGGVGKTTLAAAAVQQVAAHFTCVIWRSLLNAPPLATILASWLPILAQRPMSELPTACDEQIRLLLTYLRQQRVLLVLDNVETILEPHVPGSVPAGALRAGYEEYAQLLQHLSKSEHQSCLLLTSREQPAALPRPNREALNSGGRLQLLVLTGLDLKASEMLLHKGGLHPSAQEAALLVQHYSGNPLALQIVATTIADFFEGDIGAFQREEGFIFNGIRAVLDQQFARLSLLEQTILCWLAIERESVTVQNLRSNFAQAVPMPTLLNALHGLQARSLLEKHGDGLTLQNVIIEYTTDFLVEQIYQEIQADLRVTPDEPLTYQAGEEGGKACVQPATTFLNRFALLKAQAKEYVRQSQTRLLLKPVAERLVATDGLSQTVLKLQALLAHLRLHLPTGPGYAAGNLLNLLVYLKVDLTGYDFSRLVIRQAYLCGVNLHQTNFADSNLESSAFSDAFRAVNVVAFHPEGETLAAGTSTGGVRFWQVAGWQPVGLLNAHAEAVNALAYSPNGETLVTASDDTTLRLWSVEHNRLLGVFRGHTKGVKAVAFSPDGTLLASGGYDNLVYLWEVATQRLLGTLTGHTRVVSALCFSPDGTLLASGSWDRTIHLWVVAPRQLRTVFQGHERGIIGIDFSPDGRRLVSGSWDRSVRLWDVVGGQALQLWQGHTRAVRAVHFSHNGAYVVSAGEDTTIRMWEVATGQVVRLLTGHQSWISSIALSPDQRILVSSSWDQTIGIWSLANGQLLHRLYGYTGQILDVAMAGGAERPLMAGGGEDGDVRLWTPALIARQRPPIILRGHSDAVSAVAFSPQGEWLASASWDQSVRLWSVNTQALRYRLTGHHDDVNTLLFSPDGTLLASASDDHTVLVWATATGQQLHHLVDHPTGINQLTFNQAGTLLAGRGSNQQIALWQLTDGALMALVTPPTDGETFRSLCFTQAGDLLTVLRAATGLQIWSVRQQQPLLSLAPVCDDFSGFAFSPDGALVAGFGKQLSIPIWSTVTGEVVQRLRVVETAQSRPDSMLIRALHFSHDSTHLIASSFDETIRLWSVADGACRYTLFSPPPYTGMKITGVTGLTHAQLAALRDLGAVTD